MKKTSKTLGLLLSANLLVNAAVFADIPNGSVVIGNKAYDLNYARNSDNLKEFVKVLKSNNYQNVVIKGMDGKWYDNSTGKEINKKILPSVVYKDENGNIMAYGKEDGKEISTEELQFKVKSVSFINENQIRLEFSYPVDSDKLIRNLKIGGRKLTDDDQVSIENDGFDLIVTLQDKIKRENSQIDIEISKEISNLYGDNLINDYKKKIYVLNSANNIFTLDKEIVGDINIIADGIVFQKTNVKGDVKIFSNNVKLENLNIDGSVNIKGNFLSANSVELIGDFKEVIVNGSANIKTNTRTKIKNLILEADNKDSIISLDGTFYNVLVNSDIKEVRMAKNSEIQRLILNYKTKFLGDKSNRICEIETEFNNVKEEFEQMMKIGGTLFADYVNCVNYYRDTGNNNDSDKEDGDGNEDGDDNGDEDGDGNEDGDNNGDEDGDGNEDGDDNGDGDDNEDGDIVENDLKIGVQNNYIDVSGTLSSEKSENIALKILDDNNKVVYLNNIKSNRKGEYSINILFGSNDSGTYSVYANTMRFNEKLMEKFEFNQSLSIISFEEMQVTTGQAITLSKKVTANMSDGTQKKVDVQWDNENDIDYSTQGEYIITGTVDGTELKPRIKVIVSFEQLLIKLEELTGESVDLSKDDSYNAAKKALVKAQEAVDNMKDSQQKNEFKDRIDVSRKFIEDTDTAKAKLKEFEDAINNQVLIDYDVYRACYKKQHNADEYLYGDNNLNGLTKKSLKERLQANCDIYSKERYEFFKNPIRLDSLDTYTSYIQGNKIKGNFDLFEGEYRIQLDKYENLKEYLNDPTKEYLEGLFEEKKSLAENMIAKDMYKLKGESNKVKLIFAGEEISYYSEKYEIKTEDIDNYGVSVNFDDETGTVTLNNDKGNENDSVYRQVISIKDKFWNAADSINVDIKDVEGTDIIVIRENDGGTTDPQEATITSFEKIEDIQVTTGQAISLQEKVTANMSDGTQKEVDVQWDKENDIDISIPGEYIITGTVEGTQLKPKVKVIIKEEIHIVNPIDFVIKLEELTGESIDLSQGTSYEAAVKALTEAQEAVNNMEEGQKKIELNNRIEVSRKFIEDANTAKGKVKEFEDAINKQVLVEYEAYSACYEKYHIADEYLYGENNLNLVTKNSLKEILKSDYEIYSNDRYEVIKNPIRFGGLDTYTSYIEGNRSKGNFDLFEGEYKTLLEKYDNLKEFLNEPTKEYLEETLHQKKSLVENMITKDMYKLKGEANKVSLVFAGEEISDFSKDCEITIKDTDNYGICVTFEEKTGNVVLDNDKGNDDDLVYVQVVRIEDKFWNVVDSINVDIKDVKGADTIVIRENNGGTTNPEEATIASFEKIEDIQITTGQVTTLPEKVTANMSDGTQKEVDVQWDNENEIDTSIPGEYLITGVVEGTELKPEVKVIVKEEIHIVNPIDFVIKLEELTGDSVDLSKEASYEAAVKALVEAQEAVDIMEDGKDKNELKDRIDVSRKFIEDTDTAKSKLKEFENAINNQILVDYDVFNACYKKYQNADEYLYGENNLKLVTKNSLKEILKADCEIYNNDRYEFFKNPIRFGGLDTYTSYIEGNKSKGNFDLFEGEYKTLLEKYDNLKEFLNEPTKEYLEETLHQKKSLAENMISKDMYKLKGESNKVKLIFAGKEISDYSEKYEIETEDTDNYGVSVNFDDETGTVTLNNDKGNDNDSVYRQVIRIKDKFWNAADSINVDIKDAEGMDTIVIRENEGGTTDPEEATITSFEKIENIQVTTGQAISLQEKVIANMSDGTQKEVGVQWDNEKDIDISIPEEYIITGTVQGTQLKPQVKVVISEEIHNMNPIGLLIKLRKWKKNL